MLPHGVILCVPWFCGGHRDPRYCYYHVQLTRWCKCFWTMFPRWNGIFLPRRIARIYLYWWSIGRKVSTVQRGRKTSQQSLSLNQLQWRLGTFSSSDATFFHRSSRRQISWKGCYVISTVIFICSQLWNRCPPTLNNFQKMFFIHRVRDPACIWVDCVQSVWVIHGCWYHRKYSGKDGHNFF